MENEFTKGEWRVSLSNTSDADVVVDGFDICTCWSGYVGEDETKANAKLIAAAPDMLAALEYIVESINPIDACRGKFESLGNDRAYVGGMTLPTDESILRCIEAIKKATK